jgi:hypothetical protein
MLTDRAASPPAWTPDHRVQACRSGESVIAAEVLMNNAGLEDTCGPRQSYIPLCRDLSRIAIIQDHQTTWFFKGQSQDLSFTGAQIGNQRKYVLGANSVDFDPIVLSKSRNVFSLVMSGVQLGDHGFWHQDAVIQFLQE